MGPDTLRLVACGSVDAGKSSLIGRLLFEVGGIEADRLGDLGADPDFSRATDGLLAEREQGITIDVAHRSFRTAQRVYLLADAPGHDRYTRNMVHAASTADLALLVVDATEGVTLQGFRHLFIARLLGVRQFLVAINKMDRVAYDGARFAMLSEQLAIWLTPECRLTVVPTVAPHGGNLRHPAPEMPWYEGPTLLDALAVADVSRAQAALRMPVEWVGRADETRFYGMSLRSGNLKVGDKVLVQPQGGLVQVKRIAVGWEAVNEAFVGQAVSISFNETVDVGRGDLISAVDSPATVSQGVDAFLIWMGDASLVPGRRYRLKLATRTITAVVSEILCCLDPESGRETPADRLGLNEIGLCRLAFENMVACDRYCDNKATGSFILIDPITAETIAAGVIVQAHGTRNIPWQTMGVDRAARIKLTDQRPRVLWFTGLSGAGKSTLADLVERRLHAAGRLTYLLDGDNLRHGLTRDLGFSEADRVENIRRVAEVARMFLDAGLIVLVSLISPYRADRLAARERMVTGDFIEIFVDTPLEVCEERDPKGLYIKARQGKITHFTGISAPYEEPVAPEIHLQTVGRTPDELADRVVSYLNGNLR
ncbi:adenylyl-sulfate kinase [Lacibacterium aquatile]|uniref:Adenylyl-sulfate kinase n=1 Tax=Lacibacterium aquatile TaxID=1168082 RepID=A0ABW5DUY4_9PROT